MKKPNWHKVAIGHSFGEVAPWAIENKLRTRYLGTIWEESGLIRDHWQVHKNDVAFFLLRWK